MKLNTIVIAVLLTTNISLNIASANELPELGDVSQTVLTPLQEQAIAEQILRDIAVSDEVVQDAEVTDYLQALGARLVSNSPDKQQKFNFFVTTTTTTSTLTHPPL
jgi:predicted Zn-dependent protease